MTIAQNYIAVKEELERACLSCGRDPREVCLLAVSKTVGVDGVRDAISGGAEDFGENRVEQLVEKAEEFPDRRWHFIGNIQSRRISEIVRCASLIHSLYQEKHALKINDAAAALGKIQDVLIEVNVSGEESKSGVSPDEAPSLVERCLKMKNLRVRGLMTMAPQGDMDAARACFAGLRELSLKLKESMGLPDAELFDQLSMGMSEDWRVAVEEGSTIVRVGRAIFSQNFAH